MFNILQENIPKVIQIDYENVSKMSFDKIVAFTYVSAGVMVDCGE